MFKMIKCFLVCSSLFAFQSAYAAIAEDCKKLFVDKTDIISRDASLEFILSTSANHFEGYDISSQNLRKIADLIASMTLLANDKDCSVNLFWKSRTVDVRSESEIILNKLWKWKRVVEENFAEVQNHENPPTDDSYSWQTIAIIGGVVVAILVVGVTTYYYLNSQRNVVVVGEDPPVGGDIAFGADYLAGTPDQGTPPLILDGYDCVDPIEKRTRFNDAAKLLDEFFGGYAIHPFSSSNHINQMNQYTESKRQNIRLLAEHMNEFPNAGKQSYLGYIQEFIQLFRN